MAQLYCTGPAHLFLGVGGAFSYLGTAEDAPKIELGPEFEPVLNDVTGKKKPLDMQYQGEDALISADLNRYSETVYAVLAQRFVRPAVRGTSGLLDIGSLVLTESLGFQLAMQFPYAAKAAMAGGTGGPMPPGYLFNVVVPIGPEELTTGTKPKKIHVLLYSWPVWSPTAGTFLYTTTLPSLPAIT